MSQDTTDPRTGRRRAFAEGVRDIAPILPGIAPFGMIFGAAAVATGIAPGAAQALSLVVFAGAAQLACVELLDGGTALAVIVATVLVVNLRYLMYSAVLAPPFARLPVAGKLLAAGVMTDQGFAVAVARQRRTPDRAHAFAHYLGASLCCWAVFQLSTAAGILLGARVPAAWELDFAIPLVFLVLLVPVVRERRGLVAAVAAGATALLARDLPWNLGLILATAAGVAAGLAPLAGPRDAGVRR